MATIRLIPSTSAVSNSSYASISDASNMYSNTDSTTHGTFTHNRASTSNTYYGYLRGFNFNDVPDNATVTGFTVKIKASATGHTTSTSSSYYMSLVNNTTQIGSTSASGRLSNTVTTFTFAHGSLDWETIKGYGSRFGIRIPMRRASSGTADVISVYGAEIEVTYTVPNPRTITTTLTGDGTISPSGSTTAYDGDEFVLTITPNDSDSEVTATKDGVDITDDLVIHYVPGETDSDNRVLGTYNLVSGGFNGSGASHFQGLVGKGHTASQTTSNYYSSGSGTIAVFTYDISFNIPSNAVVTNLYVIVNGHAESTSNSSEYMCAQIISGDTALSDELNFKSVGTSNTNQTITAEEMPTPDQVANLKLQCRLGYYGGAINGATCYIEYEIPTTEIDHYTYEFEVSSDSEIDVVIGTIVVTGENYIKQNGDYVLARSVYKKINNVWTLQTDMNNVYDSGTNYKVN